MKYYLNNTEIFPENANNLHETQDETLDTSTFVMELTTIDTPIAPMTIFKLEDNNGVLSIFRVDLDTMTISSKIPTTYIHRITCVQNTKELSKHQVRNTSFTQPANPVLSCKTNEMFLNGTTTMSIFYAGSIAKSYLELDSKRKIESGYLAINVLSFAYNETSNTSDEIKGTFTNQSVSPIISSLTINLYRNDTFIKSFILSNVSNNKIPLTTSELAYLQSGNNYSLTIDIPNSITSLDGTNAICIRASLVLNTYYYTLYDILSILREQMALNEGASLSLSAPTITFKYTYIPSSSAYQVSMKITNPNTSKCTITYSGSGSVVVPSTDITINAYATSEDIIIGTLTSGNGIITAFATNSLGLMSNSTSANYSVSTIIDMPILTWSTNTNYGDSYAITNTNSFNVNCFYKIYIEGNEPSNYTEQDNLIPNGQILQGGYFKNKKVYYDIYFVKSSQTSIVSAHLIGSRVCGTLPTLTAPTISNVSATSSTVSFKITNPNSVSAKIYYKRDTQSYSSYVNLESGATSSLITIATTLTSGTIYAYASADNYTNSSVASANYIYVAPTSYDYSVSIYVSTMGTSGNYTELTSLQFQSTTYMTNVSTLWQYIENNNLYDLSEYNVNTSLGSVIPNGSSNLYGYNNTEPNINNLSLSWSYNQEPTYNEIQCRVDNNTGFTLASVNVIATLEDGGDNTMTFNDTDNNIASGSYASLSNQTIFSNRKVYVSNCVLTITYNGRTYTKNIADTSFN